MFEFSLVHSTTYVKLISTRDMIVGMSITFGIQGGRGSFNEQALQSYIAKHSIEDYEVKYLYTSENVLTALDNGEIDFGQFAIHNSIGGIVDESIKAMAAHKFEIVEEFAIQIQHFMMKPKDVAKEKIDTLMSHPQVFKQCKSTLREKYPGMIQKVGKGELIDHAMVAKRMSEGKIEKNIAVLGPKILSEIYEFEIMDNNLQDLDENWTSFLMTKRS